jgi:hypothetical protein
MKYGAGSLLLVLLLAVITIHVQERILRTRAERLLSDIRSLELRKASFADAQAVFQRWSKWGHYFGDCTEQHCDFVIALRDFSYTHRDVFFPSAWIIRPYTLVGGRPTDVGGTIAVENGTVWGKSFGLRVVVPFYAGANGPGDDGDWIPKGEYPLSAEARSTSRIEPGAWGLHPNYVIGRPGGCEDCVVVYVNFTPYADPEEVKQLMQFNLSCLTRWKPCTTHNDIMPSVWAQHLREEKLERTGWGTQSCEPRSVELMGRDAENAVIVDVIANRKEFMDGNEKIQASTVRLIRRLKRAAPWNIGDSHEFTVADRDIALAPAETVGEVRPGSRFIMLFEHYEGRNDPNPSEPWFMLDPCGVIPLTTGNLALVMRGVEQDYQAFLPERGNPEW